MTWPHSTPLVGTFWPQFCGCVENLGRLHLRLPTLGEKKNTLELEVPFLQRRCDGIVLSFKKKFLFVHHCVSVKGPLH